MYVCISVLSNKKAEFKVVGIKNKHLNILDFFQNIEYDVFFIFLKRKGEFRFVILDQRWWNSPFYCCAFFSFSKNTQRIHLNIQWIAPELGKSVAGRKQEWVVCGQLITYNFSKLKTFREDLICHLFDLSTTASMCSVETAVRLI